MLHDAKGPMLALAARGWSLRGLVSDTALAAYLVRPDQRSYDLADLTLRYLKRELRTDAADDRPGRADLRRTERSGAGGADQDSRCSTPGQSSTSPRRSTSRSRSTAGARLLAEMELPLVDLLAEIEQIGIAVDLDHLESPGVPLRRRGQAGRRGRVSP